MDSRESMLNGTGQGGLCNVQVAVRCRPVNAEERRTSQPTVIACEPETKSIKVSYGPAGKKTQKTFTFDRVFGQYSTQEEVFETVVRPIVQECLEGFNCTIFAYGQTGTGKTHTMEGDIHSEDQAGIVPRSVKAILEQLEASGAEFTIRVSFLELYNEELQDLLNTSGEKKLKLCEDVKKGVVCQNLEEITVLTVKDIFSILQRGIQERQTAATLCNKNSSRSHSIFTMKIMIKECNVDGEEVVRHGQLNLVDLAGSECVGRSGAKNDRAREAGSINQSLLTLGRVITALVDHHGHIPYRDSKLTRLLQESLGGKAKTCIIATLSPSQSAVEESLSTLDYAHRAKNIKNQPTVNQRMTKKVVLKEYCAEIEQLKSQLQLTREKNGVYVDPKEFYAMEDKIATQANMLNECESALRSKTEEVKVLKSERDEACERVVGVQKALEDTKHQLKETDDKLQVTSTALESTKMELVATEAVVGEQVVTEQSLNQTGQVLKSEVIDTRSKVDSLFQKVDRFSSCEEARVGEATSFVDKVTRTQKTLAADIQNLQSKSKERSEALCGGVGQMLEQGRITCSSLQQSIDEALSTLTGDTKTASDKMTSSCNSLSEHLKENQSSLASTLMTLQGQLSAWLNEVDVSMKAVQSQLALQQKEIDTLASNIVANSKEIADANQVFVSRQKELAQEAAEHTAAFKADVQDVLCAYKAEVEQQTQEVTNSLNDKAVEIEKAVSAMMQQFLAQSLSHVQKSATQASNMCNVLTEKATVATENISNSQSSLADNSLSFATATLSTSVAHSQGLSKSTQAISTSRQEMDTKLSSVCGSVGDRREDLTQTVHSVVDKSSESLVHSLEIVDMTSNTASTLLKDVDDATSKMSASTATSLGAFNEFMDGKGDAVCSELNGYFAQLTSSLSDHVSTVNEVTETVVAFGVSVEEGKLQPTGTTPIKSTSYAPLPTLAITRPHEVIKKEVYDGVYQGPVNGAVDSTTSSSSKNSSNNINDDLAHEMEGECDVNTISLEIPPSSESPASTSTSTTTSPKDVISEDINDRKDGENHNPNITATASTSNVSTGLKRPSTRKSPREEGGATSAAPHVGVRSRSNSALTQSATTA